MRNEYMDPQTPPAQQSEPPVQSTITTPPQENNLNKILILIIAVLVVATSILGGYYFWKNRQIVTIVPQTLQPTPTPQPQPDQFAGWKTYTSSKYGFEFKYPLEAEIKEGSTPENIAISYMGEKQKASGRTQTELSDGYIFAVAMLKSIKEGSFDDMVNERYENSKADCPRETAIISQLTTTKIGGINAKTYSNDCYGDSIMTYVPIGDFIFEITQYYSGEDVDLQKYKTTSGEILSTFRFSGQNQTDETANWKTYTDNDYKFSFKYPASWKFEKFAISDAPSEYLSNKEPAYAIEVNFPEYFYTSVMINPEGGGSINPEMKQTTSKLAGRDSTYYYFINNIGDNVGSYINFNLNDLSSFAINVAYRDQDKQVIDQILNTFQFTQ